MRGVFVCGVFVCGRRQGERGEFVCMGKEMKWNVLVLLSWEQEIQRSFVSLFSGLKRSSCPQKVLIPHYIIFNKSDRLKSYVCYRICNRQVGVWDQTC